MNTNKNNNTDLQNGNACGYAMLGGEAHSIFFFPLAGC